MELWIRSQDKMILKKINTEIYLRYGLSDYAEGNVYSIVSGGTKLGEYTTKEIALEILDEIQELDILNNPNIDVVCNAYTLIKATYNMPKE